MPPFLIFTSKPKERLIDVGDTLSELFRFWGCWVVLNEAYAYAVFFFWIWALGITGGGLNLLSFEYIIFVIIKNK